MPHVEERSEPTRVSECVPFAQRRPSWRCDPDLVSLGRWIVVGLLLVLLAGVGPLSAKVVRQEAARAAVRANDAVALLAALENGADANWADSQGTSLLHSAAALESMELVDVLLAAGADRMATSLSGSRPAHVAAGARYQRA